MSEQRCEVCGQVFPERWQISRELALAVWSNAHRHPIGRMKGQWTRFYFFPLNGLTIHPYDNGRRNDWRRIPASWMAS